MNMFKMFDKLDDIVYAPIKLVTDWAGEPLKKSAHRREMETKEQENELEIKKETEAKRILMEIEQSKKDREDELKRSAHQREMEAKEQESRLAIKKETEIKRILMEIEQCKKDRELERMKAVSEAIMKYQEELTHLNVQAISSIGHMQLDLRDRAQTLVYERTIKYKELQDSAFNEAIEDLKRIERDFPDNSMARDILIRAVDQRLANIITTAHNFLLELNADIKLLNQNISILADKGQFFIEQHLDKFHVVDSTIQEARRIEGK
jgi:hypothetical protein